MHINSAGVRDELAIRIRAKMNEIGYMPYVVAGILGLTADEFDRLLKGRFYLTKKNLLDFERKLGVEFEDLIPPARSPKQKKKVEQIPDFKQDNLEFLSSYYNLSKRKAEGVLGVIGRIADMARELRKE